MTERERISSLIQLLQCEAFGLPEQARKELVLLLHDAAWARLIAEPILRLYADEKAYFFDANAQSVYWSKKPAMISSDAGKRARAAISKMPWNRYKTMERGHWLKDVAAAEHRLQGEKPHVRPVPGRGRGKTARGPV